MALMIYDEALAAVIAAAAAPLGADTVTLDDAHGRVLAQAVLARIDAPRSAVSTMDGYAVPEGTAPGPPLRVVGEARPGAPCPRTIEAGEAVRVFTGAPLPTGATLVVMQEYAARDGDSVIFAPGFGPERHWRAGASDFAGGDVVLEAGTRLTPRALVAAAAADVARVTVAPRPRVSLLLTGDELTEPGRAAETRVQVPDSLAAGLAAMIAECGGAVLSQQRAGDDLAALQDAAARTLGRADLVVVTGGASVGAHDHARAMFGEGLTLIVDKVAIKPGKPVWLGRCGGTLVMGLPGKPTSAMVTAAVLLRPLLGALQGAGEAGPVWRTMPLAAPLVATGDRETFVRARWDADGLTPLGNQDSGAQGPLAQADCLIRRAANAGALPPGAGVVACRF